MTDRQRQWIGWWQIGTGAAGLFLYLATLLNVLPGGRVWLMGTAGPVNVVLGTAFFIFVVVAGWALLRQRSWAIGACLLCQAIQVVAFAFLNGPHVDIAAGPFAGVLVSSHGLSAKLGFFSTFFLGTRIAGAAWECKVNFLALAWAIALGKAARRHGAPATEVLPSAV